MPNKFEKEFISYCKNQDLEVNPNQMTLIKKLEDYHHINYKSFFSKLFSKQKTKKGFYLYGGVGVGKTMILNLFYDHLEEKKLKKHFNEFMLGFHDFVHEQKEKNEENVINQFVKNLKSIPYSDLGPFLNPNGPEINKVNGLVPGSKSTRCKLFADLKPIYPGGRQNLPVLNVSQ